MKTILIIILSFTMMSSKLNVPDNCTEPAGTEGLQVKIHGRDWDRDPQFGPSFYNQCVTAEISNSGSKAQRFTLPAGTFLQPDDVTRQRLMVTKSENILLMPETKRNVHLFAMCTQSHNSSPDASTRFRIGARADEKLAALSEMIEKNNYQNSAAQSAVWALSDNSPQSGIFDGDSMMTYMLRQYVAKAKNENYLHYYAERTFNHTWFNPVEVKYNYYMTSKHKVTMRLYTTDNRLFKTVSEDSLTEAGKHAYRNTFMVPQNTAGRATGLKMIRWVDNTLANITYFTKADTTFVRQ